jgi:hypothetical protein
MSERNPWLIALWTVTGLGVLGSVLSGWALTEALPRSQTDIGYAGVDWGWVNTLEVAVLPIAATAATAGTLAVLAYYAITRNRIRVGDRPGTRR